MSSDEASLHYLVVLSEPAEAERDTAYLRLNAAVGPDYAGQWYAGFVRSLYDLTAFPGPLSHPIDEEATSLYRREVRRMLYYGPGTRRSGRIPYRILFTLLEPIEGETTIRILRVLHGSQQL